MRLAQGGFSARLWAQDFEVLDDETVETYRRLPELALSYRGAEFNRLRERNRQSLAEAETSGQLRVIRGSVVTDITETAVTLKTCAGPQQLSNDFVFVLIGGESPEDFLRRTGISIVEKSLAAAPAYS